ncbi:MULTISPECIES: peptidoglycan DD-metalloendopeptidase family protein [unclassified Massilia]|uniref:peptidoglycan DD-metalloendopeptidase family protein n=1 Tax=unclassified Massilia TaxID=2609279 RepID=UPI0017816C79|nr:MULTISPECIES: peptidoglycan DD-metalloendopeptidase family protein [unclassified Massilia]MBD8532525.1 peptidoglycan DD-metalloendopeptidase family protein [Massilia sp. CFBP 13647]MBD8672985.1 peptidoglycan DD-metalloendopeptidase family protein [Massilia sp. CFBP 13721]
MKQTPRLVLLTLTIGLFAGCSSTPRHAPIVERPVGSANKTRPLPVRSDDARPDAKGFYTVRRGDTLLRIAFDHGQSYRDLVTWNNLADPDDIKVGQVLRVTPNERQASTAVVTQPVPMPPDSRPSVPRKTTPRADKKSFDDTADAGRSDKAGERAETVAAAVAPAPAVAAAAATGSRVGSTVTATDDEKLSWMWPSDGRIIATFDEGKNKGIDIAGRAGQQVMAAGAGKVMYAGSGIRGYGNLVIVKHSNSLLSAYAHNRAIVVKEGDNVAKGQVIAEMGDSDADTVKLHFEIRQQGKPVDPSRFLPSR